MRINELIVESQQIDELSLAGVGRGIGKAANIAGKAVGGAVGGTVAAAKQFGSGVKQGYQGASNTVGGVQSPTTAPTGTTAAPTPSAATSTQQATATPTATSQPQSAAPAQATTAPVQQPITVRQINQAIPTLRKRDLTSIKNTVDATVAKKMPAPAAGPAQQSPGENPNIVQGTNENFKSKFLGIDL